MYEEVAKSIHRPSIRTLNVNDQNSKIHRLDEEI